MRRLLPPVAVLAAALAATAPAAAVPPPNDNYLSSTTINPLAGPFAETVDTTEATTQADLFDPSKDGQPFGGSGPEPLTCPPATSYGKTVWYDFAPPTPGGVRITATGFDAVIALYEWDLQTSQLGKLVTCQNASSGPTEELLLQPQIRGGRNYTIQAGGVGGVGGPLDFGFEYFPDRDGDGVLDEAPDKCIVLRGIAAFGGCPPLVRGAPRLTVTGTGAGVRVAKLTVDRAERGTRIEVRCRRCGRRVLARARRRGSVRVRAFEGRTVSAGDRIEIRVTHPRARSGRFRFGALGKVVRFPVTRTGLGRSKVTCTRPASARAIRCP